MLKMAKICGFLQINEISLNSFTCYEMILNYKGKMIDEVNRTDRPLKKVLFDTTGFLEAQNLTQEQRDSRQNLYDNRSKEQCFEAICEHITAV